MDDPKVKSQDLEDRLADVLEKVDANIRKHHFLRLRVKRGQLQDDEVRDVRDLIRELDREEDDEEE